MKCRLPALIVCLALLAAWPLHAQDNGGGSGGDSGEAGDSGNSGGITPAPGANALGGNSSGASNNGASSQDQTGGTGTTPSTSGNIPDNGTNSGSNTPGAGTPAGSEGSSLIVPAPGLGPPSYLTPLPATTGASPPSGDNALTSGVLSAPTPITLSLPGGYGASEKTFTLGTGRLSKPPILFSFTISQGYDDNIQSSPSVPGRKAVTVEVEQPLQPRIIGFRPGNIILGTLPEPIEILSRPKDKKVTVSPAVPAQEPIASAVTGANLGVQIQKADPRTVFTLDGSLGILDYWKEKDLQYTGSLGLNLVHRLTPRATVSASVDAVYQNQPDFSRINSPTSNVNGSYLNADAKLNFSYAWTSRISTVSSYDLNVSTQNGNGNGDLYSNTYGTQFRYAVSPRYTATLELRETQNQDSSAAGNSSTDTFFLIGLDATITSRLRATVSTGEELGTFNTGGSTALPYLESSISLALPRGGFFVWTNRYGLEDANNVTGSTSSFRTSLALSEPLGAKLSASLSVAYNYLTSKDDGNGGASINQTQFQTSFNLQYLLSPRLSFSLSYTFLEYLVSVPNSDYRRNQTFLGVTYTF